MFKISCKDNNVEIIGTFDFGYIGIYKNQQIEIIDTLDEIREWDIVTDNLTADASDNELIDFLNEYFNAFQQKIQNNIKQINDNFLLKVFLDMEACGNEFWEIDALTIKENLPQNPEDEVYEPNWELMSKLEEEYNRTPNDNSIEKTDVEAVLRERFPMFDFDKLIESIEPECICLGDGEISFQCSDGLGYVVMCSAYDCLDENLTFRDWHNF